MSFYFDERTRTYRDEHRGHVITEHEALRLKGCGTGRVQRSSSTPIAKLERPSYAVRLRPIYRAVGWISLAAAFATTIVIDGIGVRPTQPTPTLTKLSNGGFIDDGTNVFGYAEGTTQPRTFEIDDGLGAGSGHAIARFEATNTTLTNSLRVSGTCGEWTLDPNTRKGWSFTPAANQGDSCKTP